MKNTYKIEQTDYSSYIGKLFRSQFGKGPESIFVTIRPPYLTIYFRNFLSPIEKALLEQKHEMTIFQTREIIMKLLIPEMKSYFKSLTGFECEDLYYDWNIENRTGFMIGLISNAEDVLQAEDYKGSAQVNALVSKISTKVQKPPLKVSSLFINQQTLLISREGVMTMVEGELLVKGYRDTLKFTKKNLERSIFMNNAYNFGSVLNQDITDVFIDFDFEKDKSTIIFILKSNKQVGPS
ncbi:DUF2294 domain-containing protein [Peribacillus kribbensis]|uniref:DUF2294 domain-containing protein n=1 Tax=Peribacillus kribbensis TaxID=356658 RepID=UPI000405F281|nr:Na-translocating system protein MpsC family protein [Peribacillus kribbensis]